MEQDPDFWRPKDAKPVGLEHQTYLRKCLTWLFCREPRMKPLQFFRLPVHQCARYCLAQRPLPANKKTKKKSEFTFLLCAQPNQFVRLTAIGLNIPKWDSQDAAIDIVYHLLNTWLYLTKYSHLKTKFDRLITPISYNAHKFPPIYSTYYWSQLYQLSHQNN